MYLNHLELFKRKDIILFYELVLRNQMIDSNIYCSQLKAAISEKCLVLVNIKHTMFNQDLMETRQKTVTARQRNFHLILIFIIDVASGGARGVIIIVVGNEHGDTSSNPARD